MTVEQGESFRRVHPKKRQQSQAPGQTQSSKRQAAQQDLGRARTGLDRFSQKFGAYAEIAGGITHGSYV